MEEVENLVLFPMENGRFKTSQITAGCTYEVHGESAHDSAARVTQQSGVGTPYGAYTSPTFRTSPPLPHPPRLSKTSRVIKKTIMVISLSQKNKGKAKCSASRTDYTMVTQIVVSLTSPCCQRVIGCESCVNNWMAANERCPLCSTEGDVQHRFTLKGFDDTLNLLRITSKDRNDEVQVTNESESDSSDDFQ